MDNQAWLRMNTKTIQCNKLEGLYRIQCRSINRLMRWMTTKMILNTIICNQVNQWRICIKLKISILNKTTFQRLTGINKINKSCLLKTMILIINLKLPQDQLNSKINSQKEIKVLQVLHGSVQMTNLNKRKIIHKYQVFHGCPKQIKRKKAVTKLKLIIKMSSTKISWVLILEKTKIKQISLQHLSTNK